MGNSSRKIGPKTIFLLTLTIILLIVTAITGYFILQQPFVTKKKAEVSPATTVCGKIKVSVTQSQECNLLYTKGNSSCPLNGKSNPYSSYSTTFTISSIDGNEHIITWHTLDEYCDTVCGTWYPEAGVYSCTTDHPIVKTSDSDGDQVTANSPLIITVSRTSPSGQACGTFQQDIFIDSVDTNDKCTYDTETGNIHEEGWGFCQTGLPCEAITNTPTPTATPPSQPTNTPTPTTTPTPSPTTPNQPTNTPTPTTTPTPSPTQPPGPTNTPTPTANPGCGDSCSTNAQCPSDHVCSNSKCVLAVCLSSDIICNNSKCLRINPTSTPTPTEIILAQTTSIPTTTITAQPTIVQAGTRNWIIWLIIPIALIFIGFI